MAALIAAPPRPAVTPPFTPSKPEGIDESLIEAKTFYRYSDKETTSSYETSLVGWTRTGGNWVQDSTGSVDYVNNWNSNWNNIPSGFPTNHALYTQYNNLNKKVTDTSTTVTEKDTFMTKVDSDKLTGYLWYHWYSPTKGWSRYEYYSAWNCTEFHAYYSTSAPSNYSYEPSEGSYHAGCQTCSNDMVWYIPVYTQKYTNYKKLFNYERWTEYSEWSETPVTSSSTRRVETKTMYRYVNTKYGDHTWVNSVCSVCGKACEHDFVDGICTICSVTIDGEVLPSEVIYFKTKVGNTVHLIGWKALGASTGSFQVYIPPQNGYIFSYCEGAEFTELPSKDGSGYLKGTAAPRVKISVWYELDANYDRLQDLLESYPTENDLGHTADSWNAYKAALDTATAFHTEAAATTQAEIDEMVATLQTAHSKLVIAGSVAKILQTEQLNASIQQHRLASFRITTTTDVEAITVTAPQRSKELTTCVSSIQTVNGELVKLWLVEFTVDEFGDYQIQAGDATNGDTVTVNIT